MNVKYILLLGASLESDNKGVNALGVGAITLLNNNYKNAKISLLCVGEQTTHEKELTISGEIVKVKLCYFTKHEILKSLKEAYLYKYFGVTSKLEVSELIQSSDIVFDINEGDSFSDIYGSRRIIRHFTDSKLILSWKKTLVFLPQTLGPFDTVIGKFLGAHILKRLHKLYVRDIKAFDFLDKIGVKKELSIDMAVYINPEEIPVEVKPNTVGINVSGLMYLNRYKSLDGKYNNYPVFLKQLVERILKDGYEVMLIPHTYNSISPNVEDDLEGIRKFVNDNPEIANKISFIDQDYSAQELKYVISKTVFFMGSRMHSCIAALSTSVPTIGLSYSYKFEGTFKMFKQQELVFDVNHLKEDNLDELINKILVAISLKKEIKSVLLKENMREQLSLENRDKE